MAASVHCEIVSASESIFQGSVKMLVITGSTGEMGIMPGHAALLSDLKPGPVRIIKTDDTEEVYFLSGGYVEVQPSGIAVLADTAIRADNIDEAAAAQAVKDAENDVGIIAVTLNILKLHRCLLKLLLSFGRYAR